MWLSNFWLQAVSNIYEESFLDPSLFLGVRLTRRR